jgi:hypothetical protein
MNLFNATDYMVKKVNRKNLSMEAFQNYVKWKSITKGGKRNC